MGIENAKNIKDTKICNSCKYRTRFGAMYTNKTQGYCCNYYEITGHSRLEDENGVVRRLDLEWNGKCDKYERGKIIQGNTHINIRKREPGYEQYYDYKHCWCIDRSKYKD